MLARISNQQAKQVWRVLVVEDDPQMREFFSSSVSRCAELQLMGSAGTVTQARAWLDANASTLDVLLTDLGLPDGSGLDVIRHAVQLNPACESLVISMFGDEANVLASIEAGALGYIHKDSTPADIAQTILDMRAGASPKAYGEVLKQNRPDTYCRTDQDGDERGCSDPDQTQYRAGIGSAPSESSI